MKILVIYFLAMIGIGVSSDCHGGNVTGEQPHIKFGVIANGRDQTITEVGTHVTIVWLFIDVSEPFHVFRSVKTLDERSDITFIVSLDYEPSSVSNRYLATNNKRLVKWRKKPGELTLTEDDADQDSTVNRRHEPAIRYPPPDAYCQHTFNATDYGHTIYDGSSLDIIVSNALSQFCKLQKWKSVFVFHETSTEGAAKATMNTFSMNGVMSTLHSMDTVDDLNSLLLQIYSSTVAVNQEINFVVLCHFSCVRKILKTANTFDDVSASQRTLLKHFSRWLVVFFDHTSTKSSDLRNIANDLDNLAVVAIPEVYFPSSKDFTTVLDDTIDFLKDGILSNGPVFTHCDLLRKLSVWHPATQCIGFNVDTLLWTHKGREFSPVATVDLEGNVSPLAKLLPNTNNGYSGRQFIVSTLPYPPFVIKRQENGTDVYEGTFMQLLEELARKMNFTYKLIEPEDGKWGGFIDQENLIFSGLVGQLQRKECDFVAAPLVIQADRVKVVDFSYTIYHEYSAVLQKKPDPSVSKWKTLINPFKVKVHIAIGISLACVTLLTFLLERYGHYYQKPEHAEIRERHGGLHTLHDSFWYMYGALLFQGGISLPNSMAGRTFVSTWWLFCIVVVGIYCGNLIAFLTVTKVHPLFNTLEEMIEMRDSIKWGTLGGTFWEVVFETSTIPLFREIGDGINDNKADDPDILHIQTDYHVNRVIEGGYAWIGDKTTMELAMAKECNLFVSKEEFLPMRYAYAFQKNSPHTIMFSKQIMKTHEGGLMEMWKRKWWPRNNFCSSEIVPEAKPITLADVQSAFYVCIIGTFVGIVAFITERIVYCCQRRKREKEATNE